MGNTAALRRIFLEDGTVIDGVGFGAPDRTVVELVFNTSMVGYQEIVSDPSYTGQGVVMAYPSIGNYGLAADDDETDVPSIGALVVRSINPEPSGSHVERPLEDAMVQYGIAGVAQVDTRALVRHIRQYGSCKALISATGEDLPTDEGLALLEAATLRTDQVAQVSCKEPRLFACENPEGARFKVVLIDCGAKRNIVRKLNALGCDVIAVPFDTPVDAIAALNPDGIMVSNGPGDPTDVPQTIATVRALVGKYPLFGICLGHQILSLAYGASTYKLKFGHRGGNHPVKNLTTGRVEMSSQNHSFAVSEGSLGATRLQVTHVNLLDNTIEGIACPADRCFAVQYHPESAPGPQDSGYLFGQFIALMEEAAAAAPAVADAEEVHHA